MKDFLYPTEIKNTNLKVCYFKWHTHTYISRLKIVYVSINIGGVLI